MRPFFQYYGSKWQMAAAYGPPRTDTVFEPFAGSACYSTFWEPPKVLLYDIDSEICMLWNYLIHCSPEEISAIPATFETVEEIDELGPPVSTLVRRWIWFAETTEGRKSLRFHKKYRKPTNACTWTAAARSRIVAQLPKIRHWKIEQRDYRDIPNIEAHWHIYPPYNCKEGRLYRHGAKDIDFEQLASWCKDREGTADVCEKEGAAWLPFTPLKTQVNSWRSSFREVVWRSNYNPAQKEFTF